MENTHALNCGFLIASSFLTKRPTFSSLVMLWCLMKSHISRAQKKESFLSRQEPQIHLLPRQIPKDHHPPQRGHKEAHKEEFPLLANNCDYLLECSPLHNSWQLGNKEWSTLSIGTLSLWLTQNISYNQNIHVTPVKNVATIHSLHSSQINKKFNLVFTCSGLGENRWLVTDEPVEFEK